MEPLVLPAKDGFLCLSSKQQHLGLTRKDVPERLPTWADVKHQHTSPFFWGPLLKLKLQCLGPACSVLWWCASPGPYCDP